MKRFYWKETLMLSAPVGVIALGIVLVRLISNEATQTTLSGWPSQSQTTKCEVRPATPLELSQGADFGVTIQNVSLTKSPNYSGVDYSISESALESSSKTTTSKTTLAMVWHEENFERYKARLPLQKEYTLWEETEAFKRSILKSADGIIKVDLKANSTGKNSALIEKAVELDTTRIPPPDLNAARKANFEATYVGIIEQEVYKRGGFSTLICLDLKDVTDQSQGLLSRFQTVGDWTMEGAVNKKMTAGISSSVYDGRTEVVKMIYIRLFIYNQKTSPPVGSTIRGLVSLKRGWPQEISFKWPKLKPREHHINVEFNARLAPLPK